MDTQINAATSETYFRIVKEVTSDAGVESGANLKFTWDPSYQELIVHQITIHRGADKLDRLDPSRFRIIQQENDLNRQIYNGALSAVLFLDDVRVGDEIEYSYTLRGANPSLKGKFSFSQLLGWEFPMEHQRIRLLWPETRHLGIAVHGTELAAEEYHRPGMRIYVWDLRNTPSVMVEDHLPARYSAFPWLQLSEFESWSEVGNWAAGLFETTNLDAPELKQEIASLQRADWSAEKNVQRALDFVQNDIRYLGIEFGPNSYRPTDPVTVLQRRFGDCKDKAFLLCALLRGMGYDATPVLIATGFSKNLPDLLPSPEDFNHAIVRVHLNGITYWLDPTRSYARGPIDSRYLPAYSYGLPVTTEETDLTPIYNSTGTMPATDTRESFQVGGQKGVTKLSVMVTFSGSDAEFMRGFLDTQGREKVAKDYLDDYARRYPGIRVSAPMKVEDPANSDMLWLYQSYAISNFWVLTANKQQYDCVFYPLGIGTWIAKPEMTVRSMPVGVSFPRSRIVETRVELPRIFNLTNYVDTIVGPAARLHIERTVEGKTLSLKYEYKSLTNSVPVSLVPEYLASLNRMAAALPYGLKWANTEDIDKTSQFNWPIFLMAVVYVVVITAIIGVLCNLFLKQSPRPVTGLPPVISETVNGLGGWLVLVWIALFFAPIVRLIGIVADAKAFSLWKWHELTTPGGFSYNPLWGPTLIFELLGQITLFILLIFAAVLFFQKRRLFPRWYIAVLVLNAIFVFVDIAAVRSIGIVSTETANRTVTSITGILVGCGIWIPYMCISKRVKATFVK